jgi:DNA-binding response OmpR family regulator
MAMPWCATVRDLPPEQGGELPAVALTAYARAEDRVKAIRAGFQMHLAKPVEPAELIAIVASLASLVTARRGIDGFAERALSALYIVSNPQACKSVSRVRCRKRRA